MSLLLCFSFFFFCRPFNILLYEVLRALFLGSFPYSCLLVFFPRVIYRGTLYMLSYICMYILNLIVFFFYSPFTLIVFTCFVVILFYILFSSSFFNSFEQIMTKKFFFSFLFLLVVHTHPFSRKSFFFLFLFLFFQSADSRLSFCSLIMLFCCFF